MLCARFCVDSPYALAVGGMKNGFQIIDVRQLEPGVVYAPTSPCLLINIQRSPLK